jgi:VanZ family protein
LWGYLDEVHQAFVPGRTADAWDLFADFLGSIAGAAIYSLANARKRSAPSATIAGDRP